MPDPSDASSDASSRQAANLADLLALAADGSGRLVSPLPPRNPRRETVFGGQIAAQSLIVAEGSLDDAWVTQSISVSFLRSASASVPVEYSVAPLHDGRGFATRAVSAWSDGVLVAHAVVSLQRPDSGGHLDRWPRAEPVALPDRSGTLAWDPLVEVWEITRSRSSSGRFLFSDRAWVRPAHPLPDNRRVARAATVYLADIGSGFGQIEQADLGVGSATLEHTVDLAPGLVDGTVAGLVDGLGDGTTSLGWVEVLLAPVGAHSGVGRVHGSVRDQSGRLIAGVSQRLLIRPD